MDILKITEEKNGNLLLDVEYTKEEATLIKNYYKVKRITNKLLQRFVTEALDEYINLKEK
jgi:hypothetical protein